MKSKFISEPKTNIEILHESFIKEFSLKFPNNDINDRDYTITMIRNLMLFFYYKAYKSKIITRDDILLMFNTNDISLVYKNYKNTKSFIKNPKFQQNKAELFKFFFYRFHKVYQDNLNTYNILNINIPIEKYNNLRNDPVLYIVNPNDFEVRTTQFENILKIVNKRNFLRYTSSIDNLKNKKIIQSNITDKDFYKSINSLEYPISKEGIYYKSIISAEIELIFSLIENYYPELLS